MVQISGNRLKRLEIGIVASLEQVVFGNLLSLGRVKVWEWLHPAVGGVAMQRILLIDDDPIQHELFSFYLDEAFGPDSTFTSALDLEEALMHLGDQPFDVIFLDNRLRPYTSYTETIDRIRAQSQECPIYLISAAREYEKFGNFKQHGITDAIDKFDLRQEISDGLLGPESLATH